MNAASVAVFGGLGCLLRYGVNALLANVTRWPLATLLVNLLGSFSLGVLVEMLSGVRLWGVEARLALGTGLLGGFTTYSAFNLEVLHMVERGAFVRAAGYVLVTFVACLAAGVLGLALGRAFR